jgi:hypothetical protein
VEQFPPILCVTVLGWLYGRIRVALTDQHCGAVGGHFFSSETGSIPGNRTVRRVLPTVRRTFATYAKSLLHPRGTVGRMVAPRPPTSSCLFRRSNPRIGDSGRNTQTSCYSVIEPCYLLPFFVSQRRFKSRFKLAKDLVENSITWHVL